MSRLFRILPVLSLIWNVSSLHAQERWLKLTSDHYQVVGNVDEGDLEDVAARFEAFYSALSEMFNPRQYPALDPLTAVVFDDDDGLEALGLEGGDGYFLAGRRGHYVAMRTESNRRRPFDTVLHDYFHRIARDMVPNAPLWLEEGLAEFYRTAAWSSDGSQLQIGRPIDSFVRLVRDEGIRLDFDELFAVDRQSESYQDLEREDIFHAQSWAFVHYLVTLNDGRAYAQTIRFVRLMASGIPFEEAVDDAFGMGFRTLLVGFENNVRERGTYPYLTLAAGDSSRGLAGAEAEALAPADAEAYVTALLFGRGADEEAEARLRGVIEADPDVLVPRVVLGEFLIDEGRFPEARLILEPAIEFPDSDALVHYDYALAVLGEGSNTPSLDAARPELEEAIRLDADFSDAYRELALTYVSPAGQTTDDEDLDEAIQLMESALRLRPRDPEYRFTLARFLIERQRLVDARTVLLPLVDDIQRQENRDQAMSMLQSIEGLEGNAGLRGEGFAEITRTEADAADSTQFEDSPPANIEFDRFELTRIVNGQQMSGVLSLIDCRQGLTLTVEGEIETYLFHTDTPDRVEFETFTSEVGGEIRCGPLEPPVPVVVTYQEAPGGSDFAGVPNKVEFVGP